MDAQHHLLNYRKAFNPLHLLKHLLERPHRKATDLRKLMSFFELERARKVRLLKEDVFIEEAMRVGREDKKQAERQRLEDGVLVRVLEERKLFLVETVNQCFRNNIEIDLGWEVRELDGVIARFKEKACPKKEMAVEEEIKPTKRPFLKRTIPVSCWLRPKSQQVRVSKNPILEQLQQLRDESARSSMKMSAKQRSLYRQSKMNGRRSKNKRMATDPTFMKDGNSTKDNRLNSDFNSKQISNKNRKKSRFSILKKPGSAYNQTRLYTTTTAASFFRRNNQRMNQQDTAKSNCKENAKRQRDRKLGSQSSESFSQLLDSEADAAEDSDIVSSDSIGNGAISKPSQFLKRSSSFARHLKTSFMFHRTSANAKMSDFWDDKSALQQTIPTTLTQQQSKPQPQQPSPQQPPQSQQLLSQLHSSRGMHSRILKFLNSQPPTQPSFNPVPPSSIFKKGHLNRWQQKDTKVTFTSRNSTLNIKPKGKQTKQEKRMTPCPAKDGYLNYLQNLYEKFTVFSEDKTILSFKEVKGFLRETFEELSRLPPSFSPSQREQFERLLEQKDPKLRKRNFPQLTMNDLVKLITQLTELNRKQSQKAQLFPQQMLYRDSQGHSIKLKRTNTRVYSKDYRSLLATNFAEIFKSQTSQLRDLFTNTQSLHQFTPDNQVSMDVMSRWCKDTQCKLKCNEKTLKRKGQKL